jgi:4-amino-4-deoxy-L-arabinose transferase-like glycosyltransferase
VSRALRAGLIAAILIGAFALRVVELDRNAYRPINDAGSYLTLASEIAHTGDYSLSHRPGSGAGGTHGPSAYFAPGYPYYLALVDIIDGHEVRRDGAIHPARIGQAVLGTITVALIGLVALELFGPVAALIALVLAAVYPVLVELSTVLVAENLLTPLVLAAVYAALRVRRAGGVKTTYAWTVAAGVLTGLATLTHENAILILLPLIFAVWIMRPRLRGRALIGPTLLIVATALMILPWTIRNSIVMHRLIPVSDETGITLVGTYNSASAANPRVPYKWRFFAGIPGERRRLRDIGRLTEAQLSSRLTGQALDYIGDHPAAPLLAGYHNTVRMLELEGSYAWRASATAQDISASVAHTGVISFYVLCVLALLGLVTRRVRRAPRWVWAAGILMWLSAVVVNMETPRFREPVEPYLIVLAACALAAAAAGLTARLRRAPVAAESRTAVAGGAGEPVEVIQRLT